MVIIKQTMLPRQEMRAGEAIEYKMPIAQYQELLRGATKQQKSNPQAFLCAYINEQYGLLGTCVRVIPY